jgi:FkbM family methyltransferase
MNAIRHYSLTSLVRRQLDSVTYTVRRGLIKGMRRKGGIGFIPAFIARNHENTVECTFFQLRNFDNQVVYDIGGYQGILSLFFSRTARQVITYEPNPCSAARIRENIALNNISNVTLREIALSDAPGTLALFFVPFMAGTASGDAAISRQMRESFSSVASVTVPVSTLDAEIAAGQPVPDFVKIDVEGMELAVLRGMRRVLETRRPALYLEMHGSTVEEKNYKTGEIVKFVRGLEYHVRHIESGQTVTADDVHFAREGHLFCE